MPSVKIKDYTGKPQTYTTNKIWLESSRSTEENRILEPFTYGEEVSMNVEPDFSGGDMNVPIGYGKLVTDLTVKRPLDLIASNIREGVDIAGIIGTLAAGGGSGGTGGSILARNGTFHAPERDTIINAHFSDLHDEAVRDIDGYWEKTQSPAAFRLEAGVEYVGSLIGYADRCVAKSHASFSKYGKCITLGNQYLATKNRADNTRESWLAIYCEDKNKSIILMYHPIGDINDDYWHNIYHLYVWNPETSAKTVTIEHGGNTMPDFVLVYLRTPGTTFDPSTSIIFLWGAKAKYLESLGAVGATGVLSLIIPETNEYPLDAGFVNPYSYLYCPDEKTFCIKPFDIKTIQLNPDAIYDWIAIWATETE